MSSAVGGPDGASAVVVAAAGIAAVAVGLLSALEAVEGEPCGAGAVLSSECTYVNTSSVYWLESQAPKPVIAARPTATSAKRFPRPVGAGAFWIGSERGWAESSDGLRLSVVVRGVGRAAPRSACAIGPGCRPGPR